MQIIQLIYGASKSEPTRVVYNIMPYDFGGGKNWQIKQHITVGKIKFGELLAKRTPYLINLIINYCV